MFFNAETWPSIKMRTLSEPAVRAQYEKLLSDCDGYPEKPVCKDFGPVDTPPSTPIPPVKEWGAAAAKCAFAWRMTGERTYLDKAKEMLRVSVAAYHEAYRNRRAVHWYSTGRILGLCAYDWIYEALTPDERRTSRGHALRLRVGRDDRRQLAHVSVHLAVLPRRQTLHRGGA